MWERVDRRRAGWPVFLWEASGVVDGSGCCVAPHQEDTHQHHVVVFLWELVLEHDQYVTWRFPHLLPQWCGRLDLSNPWWSQGAKEVPVQNSLHTLWLLWVGLWAIVDGMVATQGMRPRLLVNRVSQAVALWTGSGRALGWVRMWAADTGEAARCSIRNTVCLYWPGNYCWGFW